MAYMVAVFIAALNAYLLVRVVGGWIG